MNLSDERRSDERRRSPRYDKAFPVFLSGESGVAFGIARNIGEGGLYVESRSPERPGSPVVVTFTWPGSEAEMSIEAEVRFVTGADPLPGDRDHELPKPSLRGMGLAFRRVLPRALHEETELPQDRAALH